MVPENHLENKLNKIKVVLENKIMILINTVLGLTQMYSLNGSIQYGSVKESILYFDKAPSYMIKEVDILF